MVALGVQELLDYNKEAFLTISDVQKVLRIGRDKARKLVNTESFPSFKVGSSVRIPKDEFIDWYKMASKAKGDVIG